MLVAALDDLAAPLSVASAAAIGAWLALVAAFALLTRPRDLEPVGTGSLDLGPEPPAVAGFLANRWELGHEAVPATLLDLAARRVVTVEQIGFEQYVCRLRPGAADGLAPYEDQVLDHRRGLAVDRVVPCEALTTGPDEESARWWKRFRGAVLDEARRRGLSRPRWSRAITTAVGAAAVGPAGLVGLTAAALPSSDGSDDDALGWIGIAFVAWLGLMALFRALRAERDTPDGRRAAARWLGLRETLAANEVVAELPPPAVAIWDRHLAYGAALGVAHGAVRALPLGSESDREAWSSVGGRWRIVRVSYPRRFPPGGGHPPWRAVLLGLVQVVVGAVLLRVVGPILGAAVDGIRDGVDDTGGQGAGVVVLLVVALVFMGTGSALVVGALVRGLTMLVFGLPDLFDRREVEGRVLRLRVGDDKKPTYVAVDDGSVDRIRAWALRTLPVRVRQGDTVRATISPRLRWVERLEPVRPG